MLNYTYIYCYAGSLMGKNNDNNNRDAGMDTDAGKRVMVLF